MATIPLVAVFLLLSQCNVKAIRTAHEEHGQSDATFTITTAYGEVYDCVDFYEQPAFNNHLLRDHAIKFKGSNSLSEKLARQAAPKGIGLKDGGCPSGTVPILRANNETRSHHHLHSDMIFPETIIPQGDPSEADHCYAIVRTNDTNSKYLGAGGLVSVYNPEVFGPQWSAARMRLQNGPFSIEAGWMVNRDLFKDDHTHLYIRHVVGGRECINLQCHFVQVAKDVPIGVVADKTSRRGYESEQYGWTLSIAKHKDDGNWWLSIGEERYGVGYWPKSLFASLSDVANQVEWGGEVYNPPNAGTKDPPWMGCGNKPDDHDDTRYAAFYSRMTLIDEGFHEIKPSDFVEYQNCDGAYVVSDAGDTGTPAWGRLMLFGGPGNP